MQILVEFELCDDLPFFPFYTVVRGLVLSRIKTTGSQNSTRCHHASGPTSQLRALLYLRSVLRDTQYARQGMNRVGAVSQKRGADK